MKIGLPSALINPYYSPFWKTYFKELGFDVVESGKTTKTILDKGIKHAVPEICVPIKIYTGHVQELLDRGCDLVYIPRMVSIRGEDIFCPKFMGLPDMMKYTIPGLEDRMITHHVNTTVDDISKCSEYYTIGEILTKDSKKTKEAVKRAGDTWRRFKDMCLKGFSITDAEKIIFNGGDVNKKTYPVNIGVIGYVYNIYDTYVSMDILNKLNELNAGYKTFEMIDDNEVERQLKKFDKSLFWTFSNKLMAAAYNFYEDDDIDGIIHVTAFGCGPDSFLGKILEIDSSKYKKPFMTMRVDEHSGEGHLQTRIEAFVDMIARKKQLR